MKFSDNAGQHFPLKIKQTTMIGKQDLMKSYDVPPRIIYFPM
jgi:hypothetical protein